MEPFARRIGLPGAQHVAEIEPGLDRTSISKIESPIRVPQPGGAAIERRIGRAGDFESGNRWRGSLAESTQLSSDGSWVSSSWVASSCVSFRLTFSLEQGTKVTSAK